VTWRAPLLQAAARRRSEAALDAIRLGHKMTDWIALPTRKDPERWQARCWECDEIAVVHVEGHSGGVALMLRCRPAATWSRRGAS
jgi:hypothetical protein